MEANQTQGFGFEQRSATKFLVAENCKPCDIYRRMCHFYEEAYFCKKNKMFTNGLNLILPL